MFAALDRDFAEFDRREAARERDLKGGPDLPGWGEAGRRRDLAAVLRDEAARRRDELAAQRLAAAAARDVVADRRARQEELSHALAELRDRAGVERDRAASARDVAAIHRDLLALERERRARDLEAAGDVAPVLLLVTEAETDRQLATVDRLQSAMDRLAAAQDRMAALQGPTSPGLDEETGVLLTGEGLWVLGRELLVADEADRPVSAVLIDVAGQVTPERSLPRVVDHLRRGLSHRDLVVRWGPTQFLVVLLEDDDAAAWLTTATGRTLDLVPRQRGQSLEDFLAAVTGTGSAAQA